MSRFSFHKVKLKQLRSIVVTQFKRIFFCLLYYALFRSKSFNNVFIEVAVCVRVTLIMTTFYIRGDGDYSRILWLK